MKKNILSKVLLASIGITLLVGCSTKDETTNKDEKQGVSKAVKSEPVDTRQVYVSAEWVRSVIDGKQEESSDYVIIECSWGGVNDSPTYVSGHIPGAYHLNTDYIEEEKLWNVRTPMEIEEVLLKYGITKDTTVIVYGKDVNDSADDRFAFTSLWAGVENVKALDGGMNSWYQAGYEIEETINEPVAVESFGATIPVNPQYITSMEEVLDRTQNDDNFVLASVRSEDEYLAKTSGYSYIERAGEPAGAIWVHDTDDGSYSSKEDATVDISVLEGYLAEQGASFENHISFYCGTGWRASIPFLLSYQSGYDNISLYDGGWYEWQMHEDNPVQIGDPRTGEVVYTTVGEIILN